MYILRDYHQPEFLLDSYSKFLLEFPRLYPEKPGLIG